MTALKLLQGMLLYSIKQDAEADTKKAAVSGAKQRSTHRQPLVWVDLEMTGMYISYAAHSPEK